MPYSSARRASALVILLAFLAPLALLAQPIGPTYTTTTTLPFDIISFEALPDGGYLIAGNSGRYDGYQTDGFIARYTSSFELDTSFGQGGYSYVPFLDGVFDMEVLSDGRIVGIGSNDLFLNLSVVRLLPDGSRDGSFGTGGIASFTSPVDFYENSNDPHYFIRGVFVGIQSDGSIIAGGEAEYLVRFDSNGDVDYSFGNGNGYYAGDVTYPVANVKIDSNDSIIYYPVNKEEVYVVSRDGSSVSSRAYELGETRYSDLAPPTESLRSVRLLSGVVLSGDLYEQLLQITATISGNAGRLDLYAVAYTSCESGYELVFGYNSTLPIPVEIPIGVQTNVVSERRERPPYDRGQPTMFYPGNHPEALRLEWDGRDLRYWLVTPPFGEGDLTGTTGVIVKPGNPACEHVCTNPSTLPFYAGGYEILENDNGEKVAAIRIEAPAGLREVEFYNTKNLVIREPRYAPIGETRVNLDEVVWHYDRSGNTFLFTRDQPDGVVFPVETETSSRSVSFFARATDMCGRTVDVDPAFALAGADAEDLTGFALSAAAPSPTTGTAVIRFSLAAAGDVTLTIYDVLGREVARLAEGMMPEGTHEAVFDGSPLPSGVYVYRLSAGAQSITRTLVLAR